GRRRLVVLGRLHPEGVDQALRERGGSVASGNDAYSAGTPLDRGPASGGDTPMSSYLLRRFLSLFPVLWAVVTLIWLILFVLHGRGGTGADIGRPGEAMAR